MLQVDKAFQVLFYKLLIMAANLDRLIEEIKSLSTAEKFELASGLDEEAIFDDQSWYWTPEWQATEKEADDDFAAGRVHRSENVNDALKLLHQQADKADGD